MIVPIDLLPPVIGERSPDFGAREQTRAASGSASIPRRTADEIVIATNVTEDGPASAAGLRAGDIITPLGDTEFQRGNL